MEVLTRDYVDESIPGHAPGTAEWMQYLTASKIGAIMGHSNYDSWFSMWHRMQGNILPDPDDSEEARRGHYLEPSIAAWLGDREELAGYDLVPTGMWVAQDKPRYGATPDRLAVPTLDAQARGAKLALVECKSSNKDWEWGTEGTEEIPLEYYDQTIWQLRCVRTWYPEVEGVHVGVITNGLNFRYYWVAWDAEYAAVLEAKADEFMAALDAGVSPSIDPMDGHTQTYLAIRKMHPDIEPYPVELDKGLVREFLALNAESKDVAYRLQAVRSLAAEAIGSGASGWWNNYKIFNRQSKQGGIPYLVAGRNLPPADIEETETANV